MGAVGRVPLTPGACGAEGRRGAAERAAAWDTKARAGSLDALGRRRVAGAVGEAGVAGAAGGV
ncbi:MAG: hypothetical protein U0Q14_09655 [Dermatophilaceae bacterium]|nr:hypothetical protein [Dermatophilaceae bacterium]